jgi:hypothetical protein
MNDLLAFIAIVVVWILLQTVVFPKLGLPT